MRHTLKMHVHDMHAYEIYDHKVHAHETPAHYCFGGFLAQMVVDLSRSEFQNSSFCASCGWSLLPSATVDPPQKLSPSSIIPKAFGFSIHLSEPFHTSSFASIWY
jgi:hypothetical protein